MYSLVIENNEETKKAKSINKNVFKNIRHQEYVVLFNTYFIIHKMKRFTVNYIELELMVSEKFLCLVLMIKGILLIMVLVV